MHADVEEGNVGSEGVMRGVGCVLMFGWIMGSFEYGERGDIRGIDIGGGI